MTARAAREAGFAARSADGDAAGLADLVAATADPGAGALLHVRGRHAAGDLAGRLAARGFAVRGLELYDQLPAAIAGAAAALLAAGGIDAVATFSPRSAVLFSGQAAAAGWDLSRAALVSLSAEADRAHGAPEPGRRIVAPAPTRAGMIAALGAL
jgi:uroporphyrinogen-III synthase